MRGTDKERKRGSKGLAGLFIAGPGGLSNTLPSLGPSAVRIGDILIDNNYRWVLEEVEAREDELYDKFERELNAKYCVKLMSDDMFISGLTLLGKPLLRAENIPVKRLAAILVLLSMKDKGRFLAILVTGDGEVRAYRESGKNVSGIALVGKKKHQSLSDCLYEIRRIAGLRGKAVIYRSKPL